MNRIFTLLFVLLLTSGVKAQIYQPCSTCLPEGIYFSTQASIDNFQANYPGCTVINGDVLIYSYYITSLEGLSVLTAINGSLSLTNNNALSSLSGLDNITYIGGDLVIEGNDSILNLDGFNHLTFVQGNMSIGDNVSLTNLSGLDSLITVGGHFSISSNDNLLNLSGLDALTQINGGLIISGNDELINIDNLSSLTSVMDVWIHNNFVLSNLDGLLNLISVTRDLGVEGNYNLPGLNGLENLSIIGRHLTIRYNSAITNLNGLDGITSIGGELTISGNDNLTELTGLSGLTVIGGQLFLYGNEKLVDLSSLSNLTSIGGDLTIWYNNKLASLAGLDQIEANTISGLTIRYNDSLSTCEVKSICEYLTAPNGTNDITGNSTGCNSQEEVEAACGVGVDEAVGGQRSAVKISPNPAYNSITIELPSAIVMNNTTLSIFNISAQQVISHRITEPQTVVNISSLPSGIYFARMINDNMVFVGKFIRK